MPARPGQAWTAVRTPIARSRANGTSRERIRPPRASNLLSFLDLTKKTGCATRPHSLRFAEIRIPKPWAFQSSVMKERAKRSRIAHAEHQARRLRGTGESPRDTGIGDELGRELMSNADLRRPIVQWVEVGKPIDDKIGGDQRRDHRPRVVETDSGRPVRSSRWQSTWCRGERGRRAGSTEEARCITGWRERSRHHVARDVRDHARRHPGRIAA